MCPLGVRCSVLLHRSRLGGEVFSWAESDVTCPAVTALVSVCLVQGEQVTWQKLSAIQANCGIEMKLDQCMVRIGEKIMEVKAAERNGVSKRNGLRSRSLQRMSRIPSWINMSAMGAPGSPNHDRAHSCPSLAPTLRVALPIRCEADQLLFCHQMAAWGG